MTCSGIKLHFEIPKKYPALKRIIETTTIALNADWNCASSFPSLNICSVVPNISSIQHNIGIPKDLIYMHTASVTE